MFSVGTTSLSELHQINSLMAGNAGRCNWALVTIVAADALMLKHRAIGTYNSDLMRVVSCQLHKEWSLL